jgi:hypothetical protein
LVTIVSHSFELATRDGLRPNRLVRERFERLCRFLSAGSERFSTVHFADLADVADDPSARPMPPAPLRKAKRMVEQIWATARYERLDQTATIAHAVTVTAIEALMPLLAA